MKIVYTRPSSPGWHPITMMARLAAELFDAELLELPEVAGTRKLPSVRGLLPRRRGAEDLLVIAPKPQHLNAVLALQPGSFGCVVGWVIDSMWLDQVPRVVRSGSWYDRLAITDGDLVASWSSLTSTDVRWVPIGADVLAVDRRWLGEERPMDVLRIGRQPSAYADNDRTASLCAQRGLAFLPPPRLDVEPTANAASVAAAFAAAKTTLAFTTLVDEEPWTHPTVEYLTSRWTEALANGSVVAGQLPACRAARELLWPGATLELPYDDLEAGLAELARFTRSWTPEVAVHTYRLALERLDWRYRFEDLAGMFDRPFDRLDRSLDDLRHLVSSFSSS